MEKMKSFSLMTALLEIINDSDPQDSRYILSDYILKNMYRLNELDLFSIMEECFVSRSGIRRFCQQLGYENLTDLKQKYYEFELQYAKTYFYTKSIVGDDTLKRMIIGLFDRIDEKVNEEVLEALITDLNCSDNVVLLTTESSGTTVGSFQHSMASIGKIIKVVTSSHLDETNLQSLSTNDSLITISITGSYARKTEKLMKSLECKKILITMNDDTAFETFYDEVIRFSTMSEIKKSILCSTYAINYLFDKVLLAYSKKYPSKLNRESS